MINLIGALGYAALVVCVVGCGLYAVLWAMRKLRKGPEIF
jgi:hypothetical protein